MRRQDEAGRKADSEMRAQKSSFWCRCSQRKREAGTAIEPVWNRLDGVAGISNQPESAGIG
jgi:hypothetical protein